MQARFSSGLAWCAVGLLGTHLWANAGVVKESARQLPVACSVDVLVVGGSTGAVAAAAEAARSGASVFLAAPRSYLGDDMTATLRLWLEEGEQPLAPLAKDVFMDRLATTEMPDPHRISFRYGTDQPSAARHQDTDPPSLLSDLVWGDAINQSVEFSDDVNVAVDLLKEQDVAKVRVRAYHRTGSGGFAVAKVNVSSSDDQHQWKPVAVMENTSGSDESCVALTAAVNLHTRYVKLSVQKGATSARILLGEIEVIAPVPDMKKAELARPPWPRPLHVKKTLDNVLLSAGVNFLYNCLPTEVLRDAEDRVCGIVMANRAGRQAVIAKVVIDATERATIARLAGARFRPYPAGLQTFRRVVIGGRPQSHAAMTARIIEPPYIGLLAQKSATDSGICPIIEYTLQLPVEGDNDMAWAKADQIARTWTYDPDQQFTSDKLFQVPPDAMYGQESVAGPWSGSASLTLGVCRPEGVARVYVLGGCADLSRQQAEQLLRPSALMEMGTRLGAEAAIEGKSLAKPTGVRLSGTEPKAPVVAGDVRESLGGVRPNQANPQILAESRPLPVLGCYDVVVIGGGTAGAPAGIAAARQGAKTLVVEQQCGLGGVGTLGAISTYCSGNRVGFTAEVGGGSSWIIEQKMEWWRKALLDAGADIWFESIGCGAVVSSDNSNRVVGAVVATPRGRGVVLASVVVDATGNADVAAAAGAECVYTDDAEFAMQGTGLPPRQLGATYTNTDYAYTDETDLVDVWHLFVYAKEKYPAAFDLGKLVDTRERRRIVGGYTLTILDQVLERTFPDTIAQAAAGYDTHGYVVDPFLMLRHPSRRTLTSNVPYRCLLPRGFDGLLVTGIALSAQRDAQPVVRMQPDIQNQGYAAGAAAAMASRAKTSVRSIDIRTLQKHLVDIGNLPAKVLTDVDSLPIVSNTTPQTVLWVNERIARALPRILEDYRSAAMVMSYPDYSRPLLQQAYRNTDGQRQLLYAKVLGMLGDPTGLDTLLAEVTKAQAWDAVPDWRMQQDEPGFDQVGWSMSHLDNTLVAIGRTRRPEAVPAVLKKVALLTSDTAFSHYRAVCLALESLGDPRAAQPLAELLQRPGMGGHAVTSIAEREASDKTRLLATRELIMARTLYRCGDWDHRGKNTLEAYTKDFRGHFARHASAVLAGGHEIQPPVEH